MFPFALISGYITEDFGQRLEVRVLELEEDRAVFRTADRIGTVSRLELYFYDDRAGQYDGIALENPAVTEKKAPVQQKTSSQRNGDPERQFYFEYEVEIAEESYKKAVQKLYVAYDHYIQKKLAGDDAALSEDYTGYPAKLDDAITTDFARQRAEWYQNIDTDAVRETGLLHMLRERQTELAVELDCPELYEQYLDQDAAVFYENYWKEHGLSGHPLAQYLPERLYIGNQFCPHLIPDWEKLKELLDKAEREQLSITLMFSYLREERIADTRKLLDQIAAWCDRAQTRIEIVAGDWGMLSLICERKTWFEPVPGVLLNKRRKDPRVRYKIGVSGEHEPPAENALNSSFYRAYLKKAYGITRFEQESCGYCIQLPEGKNSIHFPFYQTNTSQYCPLYARCKEGSRGRQREMEVCPRYCRDYVFSYPDHLHMVGRYNSLFSYDTQILTEDTLLFYYIAHGADRIVLNLM
mgnify:CR=1 FL=1